MPLDLRRNSSCGRVSLYGFLPRLLLGLLLSSSSFLQSYYHPASVKVKDVDITDNCSHPSISKFISLSRYCPNSTPGYRHSSITRCSRFIHERNRGEARNPIARHSNATMAVSDMQL